MCALQDAIYPFQGVIGTISYPPASPSKHAKTPILGGLHLRKCQKTPKNTITKPKNNTFSQTNPPPAKMAFGGCFWMACMESMGLFLWCCFVVAMCTYNGVSHIEGIIQVIKDHNRGWVCAGWPSK